MSRVYPLPALVGQPLLEQALLMLAVNPRLSGVLIRGEKGTAKSTAARALARLLPEIRVNRGCKYGCPTDRPAVWCTDCTASDEVVGEARRPPFETLPLGTTEDQLLGTLDLERALRHGEQRFAPGLLARVNQGVLYVDEVNLLEDHLVDLLLDVAAMGVNTVARDGVSVRHPAEFVLVGTMNPEEGDLRPQLLDRFGLCVEMRGLRDPAARAEIVTRRLAFDADPAAFVERWSEQEAAITHRVTTARSLLPQVQTEQVWCLAAAHLALSLDVPGHRADVLLVQGAATLAALDGRTELVADDLERAATVVLPHRLQRRPGTDAPEVDLRAQAREAVAVANGDPPGKARAPAVGPGRT